MPWIILVRFHFTFCIIYLIVSICYILEYILYIFSEITVTILIPHKNYIVQQLKLSNTNKCPLDKRKVTWQGFEPTYLTSPVKITLSNECLNRSAIVFAKRVYWKQLHYLLVLQQSLGDVLKWSWFSKLLIIQIWLLAKMITVLLNMYGEIVRLLPTIYWIISILIL